MEQSDPYQIIQLSNQKNNLSSNKKSHMNLSFDSRNSEVKQRNKAHSQSMIELPQVNQRIESETNSRYQSSSRNESSLPRIYSNSSERWGIEGYKLPNNEYLLMKPKGMKWIKEAKHDTFVDIAKKQKAFLPPPNQYQKPINWNEENSNYQHGGSPLKGKFLKGERVTFQAEIIRKGKKLEQPCPGTYSPKSLDRVIGLSKSKIEKGLFIDEARYVGMQTPGFVYNSDVNYVRPKIFALKIIADKKNASIDIKFKKSDDPSPGQYDIENSYKKTQFQTRVAQFSKKKHQNFVDIYKKTKEFLPAVGAYNNVEKAYTKISTNPPSIKTKRH